MTIAAAYRGFRDRYLDYAALTEQVQAWRDAFPEVVGLSSLGPSPGGRELWLLTIGRRREEQRPAVWVDGNIHASEVCGSSVALAIAEDVLALHQGGNGGLPEHVAEQLRETLFYILPRLSPDGAETTLGSGRYVRSSALDERTHQGHAYWRGEDLDGDGRVRLMRLATPDGELAELPGHPGVLVPRELDDSGPFYRVFPEGLIANYDGYRIPDSYFLADNQTDFNRNFPYDWAPEPVQAGAGDYPGSAVEIRAVLDFAARHPNIFVWLNLHTFGGVMLRPLADQPDAKMNQGDLAVYRQAEAWMTQHTGYPAVSVFHDYLYQPDKPMNGDLASYAYRQRGCLAYVVELWDLFTQLGMARTTPFVDIYSRMARAEVAALVAWDREHNRGRIFQPWTPFDHPQLGAVELGGPDLRFGITNPPYELLDGICRSQSAAFLRVAALLPRLVVEVQKTEAAGPGLTRLTLRVRNAGYLATYGLPSAAALPHAEPLRAAITGTGCRVLAPAEAVIELGHLSGWGHGLHTQSLFFPWTRGNSTERSLVVLVEGQGEGEVQVEIGSCRTGKVVVKVAVGGGAAG